MTAQLDRIELNTGLTLTDTNNIVRDIDLFSPDVNDIGNAVTRIKQGIVDMQPRIPIIQDRVTTNVDAKTSAAVTAASNAQVWAQAAYDAVRVATTPAQNLATYEQNVIKPQLDRIEAALTAGSGNPDIAPVMAQLAILQAEPNESLNALAAAIATQFSQLQTQIQIDLAALQTAVNQNTVTVGANTTASIQAQLEACCEQMIGITTEISASVGVELTLRVDDILATVRALFAQAEIPPGELVGGATTEIEVSTPLFYPVPGEVYDIEIVTVPKTAGVYAGAVDRFVGLGLVAEIDVTNTPFNAQTLTFGRQRILSTSIQTAGLLFACTAGTVLRVTPYTRP